MTSAITFHQRSSRTRRAVLIAGVGLAGTALIAACSSAPKASSSSSSSTKYLPCIVSDQGGFDDHSFNQLGLEGVQAAAKTIGGTFKQVQSKTANDYASNISNLITQKCDMVVASGFNLVAAVKASAKAHPKTDLAMIDDNSIKAANVKPVVYETDEAAFLGGYAAAAYSKTGSVATYGGAQYPSVTIYMDGIADGVAYYNKEKGKSVKVLGWDEASQKGTFVGNFTDQNASKTDAQNFLDQGADVIIPVAGSLYQGAAAAIQASGKPAVLEGVDADVYATDTNGYKGLFLTSILKNIKPTVDTVVTDASKAKTFDNSQYVGTLKNGGVGLAPFHDYESKVDPSLAGELKTIQAGITDGSITVDSPSKFTK